MRLLFPFLLLLVSINLMAIKITPPFSKSIWCYNNKSHKTIIIHQNSKISIWYKNESITKKITGILTFVNDSIAFVRKNNSYLTIEIPINTIQGISKRNSTKLIFSSIALVTNTFISVFTIKILDKASNSRTTNTGTINRGNGLAGVIGLVIGIIIFPITIASAVVVTKQLLHKKMLTNNGWSFTAR